MIVEDHRNISCGGDPFSYLKSVMKGLNIQMEPGQDAKILLLREKFPYDPGTFEGLAKTTKLLLVGVEDGKKEINLILRKPH